MRRQNTISEDKISVPFNKMSVACNDAVKELSGFYSIIEKYVIGSHHFLFL